MFFFLEEKRKEHLPLTAFQCWINEEYEPDRLWTHYFWIFLAEFGTVILYSAMYFQLRRRIAASIVLGNRHVESLTRLRHVINTMVMYPVGYVVLSLPLAAGRMATARGHTPSVTYFCVAGAMITSSGFVDVIMYAFTRRRLVLHSEHSGDRSLNPFHHYDYRSNHITTVTVEHKREGGLDVSGLMSGFNPRSVDYRSGSMENIIDRDNPVELSDLSKVYQKTTTIEITSEPAFPPASSSPHYPKRPSSSSGDERDEDPETGRVRERDKAPGRPKRAWRRP
jgi:hypothetical protein